MEDSGPPLSDVLQLADPEEPSRPLLRSPRDLEGTLCRLMRTKQGGKKKNVGRTVGLTGLDWVKAGYLPWEDYHAEPQTSFVLCASQDFRTKSFARNNRLLFSKCPGARARARQAPAILQQSVAAAPTARWSALLTHAAVTSFAATLLGEATPNLYLDVPGSW